MRGVLMTVGVLASATESQPRRRVRRPITRHVCLAQPRTGISPVISVVAAPARAKAQAFGTAAQHEHRTGVSEARPACC